MHQFLIKYRIILHDVNFYCYINFPLSHQFFTIISIFCYHIDFYYHINFPLSHQFLLPHQILLPPQFFTTIHSFHLLTYQPFPLKELPQLLVFSQGITEEEILLRWV